MSISPKLTTITKQLLAAFIGVLSLSIWVAESIASQEGVTTKTHGTPTPGLTNEEAKELVKSVQARCKKDLACFQRQEALEFSGFSAAYDKALSATDSSVLDAYEQACILDPPNKTPFYLIGPCSYAFHRGLLNAAEFAEKELAGKDTAENSQTWNARFKTDLTQDPRTLLAFRALNAAMRAHCPGEIPDRACSREKIHQLVRDEHLATEQSRIAQISSSRLIQIGGACIIQLKGNDHCQRKPLEGLSLNSEPWEDALGRFATHPYLARVQYRPTPLVPPRAAAASLFGASKSDLPSGPNPLIQCIRLKNGGNDIGQINRTAKLGATGSCISSLTGTPLEAFDHEVAQIQAHLSTQSYFDMLRLMGIFRMMDAHRRFIGVPFTQLPSSCRGKVEWGFGKLSTSTHEGDAAETPEQRRMIATQLRDAARQVAELLTTQAESLAEVSRAQGIKNGERCDYLLEGKPGQAKCASDIYAESTQLIEKYFNVFPLLSAGRDPSKTEFADSGRVFEFANARDDQLENVLAQSRTLLAHSLTEGLAQLCTVGDANGLDWQDLATLPVSEDPIWEEQFAQFHVLRACLREVRRDERIQHSHAAAVLGAACFFADLPTLGLASSACEAGAALQSLKESAHAITWLGRCRAAGNALCSEEALTRARFANEQANQEILRSGVQAGINLLTLGAGAATHQIAELSNAVRVKDLRPLPSFNRRLTPPLPKAVANDLLKKFGLPQGKVQLLPFKSGGVNDVYSFAVKNSRKPIRFGISDDIPPKLRGRLVSEYKVKLTYRDHPVIYAERDRNVFEVLSDLTTHESQFEGIHVPETFYLGVNKNGQKKTVQATVHGDGFTQVLDRHFNGFTKRIQLSSEGERGLFASLYQSEMLDGMTPDELFAPQAFRERYQGWAEYNTKSGLEPIHRMTDAEIALLRQEWTSADMVRVRELTKKLQLLNNETELLEANAPMHSANISIKNTPIWGLNTVELNGDFGYKNVIFWRGPDGRLNLSIVDF